MTTTHLDHAGPIATGAEQRVGWTALLRWGAITAVLASAATMVLNRFVGPSMLVLIAALLAGLWLLRRHQRAAVVTIGVVSALDLAFHGPLSLFLLPIIDYPKGWIPGTVGMVASIVNVSAAVAAFRSRRTVPTSAPRVVATAAVALVAVGAIVSLIAGVTAADEPVRSGDVALVAVGNRFSDQELSAESGEITVHVTNLDPIMHTLVIPELDVVLAVPDGSSRRATFTAPPGRYDFHDEITLGNMRGVLVVR